MFKLLSIIALIASIGQSNASLWQRVETEGLGAVLAGAFGRSIIHIKNDSGHAIRVGTSENAGNVVTRTHTLIAKGFNGDYDVILPGGSENYETYKKNVGFTVAAQYHEGKDFRFTYCAIDTAIPSHNLVFRNDGGLVIAGLKCHEEPVVK